MTPEELFRALKERLDNLERAASGWFRSASSRLRDIELRLARMEEREDFRSRLRAPWYSALAQAVLAGLAGAAAALFSGALR